MIDGETLNKLKEDMLFYKPVGIQSPASSSEKMESRQVVEYLAYRGEKRIDCKQSDEPEVKIKNLKRI